MKKENIFRVLIPILFFVAFILAYYKFINNDSDAIRFKKEYEKGNDTYYKVKISHDNSIVYSSYKEIFNVLKSKTGIIFLGYPEDNNSRFAINALLKVLTKNKKDTKIYYLDIHNDRDYFTIDNNEVIYDRDENGKELKGTENYLKLVELLDSELDEYILYLDEKEYDTNVKRIHLPSIIFVKDGNILSLEYADIDMGEEDLSIVLESDLEALYSEACDIKEAC